MARVPFGIEKAIRIFQENSDTVFVDFLFGAGSPGGDSGEQDAAPIGSLYVRTNGQLWQKTTDGNNSNADWQLNGSGDATIGTWRPESVVAVTNAVQGAGTRDMVANPFSDDDGTPLPVSAFVVGKYVISGAGSSPQLLEITAVSGDDVTFALGPALVDNDTFVTKHYLPDPDGFENTAIVNFNGTVMIKIADVDWNFANGINIAVGYTPTNGTITDADSVQSAIEKLDGNQQDLTTLSGVTQGSVDLGTFTGDTIADNQTVKGALQDLETAHEALSDDVDLIDDKVDDLITLSGVAANSTDLGIWSSPVDLLFSATSTIKALFQRIGDLLMQIRGVEVTGVTSLATIDAMDASAVRACKWLVVATLDADPSRAQAFEVFAVTNGSNASDDTVYAKLRVGASFNFSLVVDVVGSELRLRASTTTGGVTVTARRIEVVKTVL